MSYYTRSKGTLTCYYVASSNSSPIRELLSFDERPLSVPHCRVRGTPLASSPYAQSKKRSLAATHANQILRSQLDLAREENRRMRRERAKEEETLLLTEADRQGSLPPLRSLRESVMQLEVHSLI